VSSCVEMVNLSGAVGLGGLRPQQAQVDPFKNPTKTAPQVDSKSDNIIDAACVTDLPRPRKIAGRTAPLIDRPAATETTPSADDAAQERCLVRSPSGSKMVNPETPFPFGACFTFWLRRDGVDVGSNPEALGSCNEVVNFWKYWNGIVLDRLPPSSLLAVFRHPDRPRAGPKAAGGKWVICPSAKEAANVFEELTLALVGGEFDETNEGAPSGVAFSNREKHIEVWNRCASDAATEPVLAQLREFVSKDVTIEYRPHRGNPGQEQPATPSSTASPKCEKTGKTAK